MVLLGIPSRLHARSKHSSPVASRTTSPKPMADTNLILKATAVQGRNLAPKDKNGFSDPYLVLNWSDYRFQTEAQPKTLDPVWNDSFDMPLNGASGLTMVCVCWDKDRFGKDYMGEFSVSLDEIFNNGKVVQEPRWFQLKSSRKKATISGEIQLQFTLIDPDGEDEERIFRKYTEWQSNYIQLPSPSWPDGADEDPFSQNGDDTEYDEDDESPSPEEHEDLTQGDMTQASQKTSKKQKNKGGRKKAKGRPYELNGGSDVVGVIFLEISSITDLPPERNMTRTGFDMDPFVVVSLGKKTYRTRHIRHSLNPVYDEKMIFQVLKHEQNFSLSFSVVDKDKFSSNDFVAQTTLPVQEVLATQPMADPATGLYNLPGTSSDSALATPPITPSTPNTPGLAPAGSGSSQNGRKFPKFPLSRSASGTSLAPRKRPELSHRASTNSLRSITNKADTQPGFEVENIDYDLKPYTIPLPLKNKDRWEDKHKPELHLKVAYFPYPALRQQFWRTMLKEYDSDDSGRISRIELTTMLDTLGSTLSSQTIDGFFERYRLENHFENMDTAELTIDQAVMCLENQLAKQYRSPQSGSSTPNPFFSGSTSTINELGDPSQASLLRRHQDTVDAHASSTSIQTQPTLGPSGEEGQTLDDNDLVEMGRIGEHVIQIKECPLCHQPRLNKRSDVDIVTHLATCASQDWRQVDKLVMGGFVTSSQAQRKWYSKVISKISYGGYKLGANSANILVQDRVTGMVQEERMSVYVRLGIRLLYKGLASSRMEDKKIRKLLYSLSIKQGKKFDNPASAKDIPGFIAFHQLDMSEVLKPLEEFKTFNEFFYRALKPGARPCSAPNNPKVIVSPADCRSVVFNTVTNATKVWIKGREFSISRLLGDAYPEDVKRFENGALGIFRLAPQDYHRFHIPVDGVLGKPKLIKGEYYTVNPMAIRSALDVYGENVRICVPIESEKHGRVMAICVGAMMVGSTVITASEGQKVQRTDELGYFQFGGSTIVLLFEPGRMVFDDDLVENSNGALETLIRVGMSIGHTPDMEAVQERKDHVTNEEKQDARRRIGGSLAPPMQ